MTPTFLNPRTLARCIVASMTTEHATGLCGSRRAREHGDAGSGWSMPIEIRFFDQPTCAACANVASKLP